MRKLALVSLAMLVVTALALPAAAGDDKTVTLEGEMVCAKCTLKEEGLDKCQNVLAVEQDGKTAHFYMVKNEANKEFGDVCMVAKEVKVTGTLSEKDGKTWIAATEIVIVEKEG